MKLTFCKSKILIKLVTWWPAPNIAIFFDAASVWGVDYNSSINAAYGGTIRSSIGIGIDWFTILGPLNFSFAHPISKEEDDSTESFRFNIGTSF